MKTILIVALLLSLELFARGGGSFGGSRGGGGGFSGGRSSFGGGRSSFSAPSHSSSSAAARPSGSFFGGNRSAGSAATITRPANPAPASPARGLTTPAPVQHQPSVVNNYGGGGGYGGGNGFFTGWLFGQAMNPHPGPTTVVVGAGGAPNVQAGQPGAQVAETTVVAQPAPQGPGFFGWLLRILVWGVLLTVFAVGLVGCYFLVKERVFND